MDRQGAYSSSPFTLSTQRPTDPFSVIVACGVTFIHMCAYACVQVVLAQLAVPSRQDVEEYQNLRATVNELVGRINGRFGTVEFMPIHFMHKSLPFDELCALYAVSDVCLVSSTRDGMNLVGLFFSCSCSLSHYLL